jgi:hypothetical protein
MKYIVLLTLLIIAWLVVDRVLSQDTASRRLLSLRDRWRVLRGSIHIAVGIVAALILIIFFLQLVFRLLA